MPTRLHCFLSHVKYSASATQICSCNDRKGFIKIFSDMLLTNVGTHNSPNVCGRLADNSNNSFLRGYSGVRGMNFKSFLKCCNKNCLSFIH